MAPAVEAVDAAPDRHGKRRSQPDRVKPRNIFNLGIGTDNLFHTEKREKITASFDIANITNKVALYNFLSTFSGTHFLQRARSSRASA